MQNVDMSVDAKGILTIKVDTKKRLGLSKSGKTIGIASTQGNQAVPGLPAVVVGLNVYTKDKGEED